MVLHELGDQVWDLIVFTETWRAEKMEVWRTEHGHTWLGSGGTEHRRGVGFLLHARRKHVRFKPLSERAALLDIRAPHQILRIFAVYMPHSAQPDEDVDEVYAAIGKHCNEAKSKGYMNILTGDFNAEIGTCRDFDDPAVVGTQTLPRRSERGALLLNFCTHMRHKIMNTFHHCCTNEMWTYRNGISRKVLDYFLVDICLAGFVIACYVLANVDTGSDHRPLLLAFRFGAKRKRKKVKTNRAAKWKPDAAYAQKLDEILSDMPSLGTNTAAKTKFLHDAMLRAREDTGFVSADVELPQNQEHDIHLRCLIEERKGLAAAGLSLDTVKHMRVALGKQIQKAIRAKRAHEKTAKINTILSEFKDLKRLSTILGPPKTKVIVEVQASDGDLKNDKADIAEVFAQFYEDLYRSKFNLSKLDVYEHKGSETIAPFTINELTAALKQMKGGKACDTTGICAEMLKVDCPFLHEVILSVFNDVLTAGQEPPPDWRKSRLVVLFKKGDASMPSNYRPIAILPILYKLFSRMLCGRVKHMIIEQQSVDQAAYRKGFNTEDHLISLTLLTEACAEWNVHIWLGLLDFEKAFDTVEHKPLWKALQELQVQEEYIDLLKTLYCRQSSTVLAGKESRPFDLERGVKQGDPISSLLFLSIMEVIFRRVKARWHKLNQRRVGPYYGIVIDNSTDPLTNLRFADDVLLVATSKADVRKMLEDVQREAATFGLKLHMGKTKILTTDLASQKDGVTCAGKTVQILKEGEWEKYLGRKVSIEEFHATELDNRIAMGWGSFFRLKGALCNRKIPIRSRIALFDSSVTPCVLYACATWTMNVEFQRILRCARRRMLRWMIRPARKVDEEWPDYIRRSTYTCEDLAAQHGSEDWIDTQRKRKCILAAKCSSCSDGRWSSRLLHWKPWFRCTPRRNVGHPVKRWTDDF